MLRAGSSLTGYGIEASDGPIGTVSDLLFDDKTWKVRWVVVDTGTWLTGRKVLIHPSSIQHLNFETQKLVVPLSKANIQASPDILWDQPVSRQMEYDLHDYYDRDPLWGGSYYDRGPADSSLMRTQGGHGFADANSRLSEGDPDLRGAQVVTGYHIHATDGTIGHLENLLIDDLTWTIDYLVVDTRNWWPGQHVLLAPFAVRGIDWSECQIRLGVTRAVVKSSPAWDPAEIVNQVYQKSLHLHYDWPAYGW